MRRTSVLCIFALVVGCSDPGAGGLPPVLSSKGIVYGTVSLPDGSPVFGMRVDAKVFGQASLLGPCEDQAFTGSPSSFVDTDAGGGYRMVLEWLPQGNPETICLGVRTRPAETSGLMKSEKKGILLTFRIDAPYDSVGVHLVALPVEG